MWGKRDEGLTNYSDPSLRSHVFFTAELWVNYARYGVDVPFSSFFSFLLLLERERIRRTAGKRKKRKLSVYGELKKREWRYLGLRIEFSINVE